ncbi:MAG: shikimate kinase [Candidatus Nanopelagicales bacterium]
MSPRALLVGAPGAGKTTVGRRLAEYLAVEFRDTDDEIVLKAGKPIADIFIDQGEDAFRAMETQALREVIGQCDGVVSLGGGVVMRAENRVLLTGLPVVWLEVSLSEAVKRVGMGTARPLLMGNVRGRLMQLMAERTPVYEAVATLRVVTSGREVDTVVEEIAAKLEGGGV